MSAELYRSTLDEPREQLAIAFDFRGLEPAIPIMRELNPFAATAKFNAAKLRAGLDRVVDSTATFDMHLMDDGKYRDTPRTVADSVAESTAAGSRLITVHLQNTVEALEMAVDARNKERERLGNEFGDKFDPLVGTLLGITVLTSYDAEEYQSDYGTPDIEVEVLRLAIKASKAGFEGVVSSADELPQLQGSPQASGLLKLVPGLVLEGGEVASGQRRVNTFANAVAAGADIVVGGSAITKAPDMAEAARAVLEEIREGRLRREA